MDALVNLQKVHELEHDKTQPDLMSLLTTEICELCLHFEFLNCLELEVAQFDFASLSPT